MKVLSTLIPSIEWINIPVWLRIHLGVIKRTHFRIIDLVLSLRHSLILKVIIQVFNSI